MKKLERKLIIAVSVAVVMFIIPLILFETAANSTLMQHNLRDIEREPTNLTGRNIPNVRAESAQSETSPASAAESSVTNYNLYDLVGETVQFPVREIVMTSIITPVVFDSVDIYVWREFQRMSNVFDIELRPINTNFNIRRELQDIRNAIRDDFEVILIHPSCSDSIIPAIRDAFEAGLIIGTFIDDISPEGHDYRHFFVPFEGTQSGLTEFPDNLDHPNVKADLTRMVLYTLRSIRSVLDHGFVNPNLVTFG